MDLFDRLVDNGATVIVVEHNLALVSRADYVIDLGPGGGSAGGRIVAAGTPADIAGLAPDVSATAPYLAEYLGARVGA